MDLQGSLVDTNLRIYPANNLINYLKSLPIEGNTPVNIAKFIKGKDYESKQNISEQKDNKRIPTFLNNKDIENLNKIRASVKVEDVVEDIESATEETVDTKCEETKDDSSNKSKEESKDKTGATKAENKEKDSSENEDRLYLTTSDIDWLYDHLQKSRSKGDGDGRSVPYLHALLEGAEIQTPKNKVLKRNPILEARCVKLRAQQEAREYRKMTKSVDNVRMKFPEDSISYQLKQVNRQLIAIGQFIISIFAGFLFGFKGLEWMIGHLDFGFRLLLGVMCALIIALAEIYFLAKKLNEELNIPEPIQLGGPLKFADQETQHVPKVSDKTIGKEHQD